MYYECSALTGNTVTTLSPTASNTAPFRFLDLPAELREAIYDLCLVRGTVCPARCTRYDHRYDNIEPSEEPEWALLLVNRKIRHESAKILLSKNHFILSYVYISSSHSDWSAAHPNFFATHRSAHLPDRETLSFERLAQRHLKSVSVTLDLRGLACDALGFINVTGFWMVRDSRPEAQRTEESHEVAKELTTQWTDACLACRGVEFVQIDMSNAYCPLGCCRYYHEAATSIAMSFNIRSPAKVLEVVGADDEEERNAIKASVQRCLKRDVDVLQPGAHVLRFKSTHCDNRHCRFIHVERDGGRLPDEDYDLKTLRNEPD